MSFRVEDLRTAAAGYREPLTKSLTEARQGRARTAFLCHSHADEEAVKGFLSRLAAAGWNVYVDWKDPGLPPTPTRETARRIKEKIGSVDFFLFLATKNSVASRWCPWEIGYADGVKRWEQLLVVATSEGSTHYGNEYLQLYRQLDSSHLYTVSVKAPGETLGTPLRDL